MKPSAVTLTKSQIAQLSKWAKAGRLIVRPLTHEELPEWARCEFRLARIMSRLIVEYSVSGKMEAKSNARVKRYREGSRKGWVTRKLQKRLRAASAEAEVGEKAA